MAYAPGGRWGPWALSLSGRRVYILDPRPEDFCLEDVAHGLACEGRWANQTRVPYYVAQHSCMVADIVEAEVPHASPLLLLRALMHDAPEAFLGDVIKPLKYELSKYRRIEHRMMRAMCEAFALPVEADPIIKYADHRAVATERRDLHPREERRARIAALPLPERIQPWSWAEAEERFLARYDGLFAAAGGRRAEVGRARRDLGRVLVAGPVLLGAEPQKALGGG